MSEATEQERPSRGAMIVVEGLDRAGKSTQVGRLSTRWEKEVGQRAKGVRFPGKYLPSDYLIQSLVNEARPMYLLNVCFCNAATSDDLIRP
jgi:dTMP kinase